MTLADLIQCLTPARWRKSRPVVAVLRFDGVIGGRGQRSLSLRRFAGPIERAFAQRNLAAVALAVNSPGGSPVQSSLLHRRIRQLAQEHNVPVLAFAEDVAASGGYWLALAADEIFVDETSILGSIGVVTATFGLVEAMERLGVERRLHAMGEDKSLLDPFLPEQPRDVERLVTVQRDIHDAFKALVRTRRGARLAAEEAKLFTGEIFVGQRAVSLGLADGIGDLRGVLRQRFGDNVRLRLFEPERRRFSLLSRGRPRGLDVAALASEAVAFVEERLLWSRFGL